MDIKRIIRFIGLKVAETTGVVLIPWGIGKLVSLWPWYIDTFYSSVIQLKVYHFWFIGFMAIIQLVMVATLLILSIYIVNLNWKWAKGKDNA